MDYRMANHDDIDLFVKNRIEFASSITNIEDAAEFEARTRKYLEANIGKEGLIVFLAIDNNTLIASCMACIYTTAPLPSCLSGKTAEILNVYTKEEHRRKGHAKALLNLLTEEAKRRGVEKMKLDYTEDGLSLYEQMGFSLSENKMQKTL